MPTVLILVKNVFIEFWALCGIFVTGGAVLTFLARWTNNVCGQFIFPRMGFYLFGFIGIPVHEFSHAVFCKIFLHDIGKVKWFDPKGKGGSSGSVTHHYNPWNLYHRVGHFFIGLGPTILGPIFLALLFYFLVPTGRHLFAPANSDFAHIVPLLADFAKVLASRATLSSPGFYLFLYLAVCISSQIELSSDDLKQAMLGTLPILLVLLIANLLSLAFGGGWHDRALNWSSQWVAMMACLFALAAFLSALNLALLATMFGLINKLCGRPGINPFAAA